MGVLREAEAERIELEASSGDLLILLSDGVMGERDDGAWLKSLLLSSPTSDPSALALRILDASERENGEDDDRTVLVLRLNEARAARKGA